MKRWLPWARLPLAACGSLGTGFRDDAGPADPPDAAATLSPDGARPGVLDSGAPSPNGEGDMTTCFNGVDDDSDQRTDCAQADCRQAFASCAAGAADGCDPDGTASLSADCTAGATDCLRATPFGLPAPTQTALEVRPNGDATGDSGVLSDVVSLAQPLDLVATLDVPDCGGAACREAIGVALVRDAPLGDAAIVAPLVGVVASAERTQLSLVVGGQAVGNFPLSLTAPVSVTLHLSPLGTVTVDVGASVGVLSAQLPEGFPRAARIAVYGRNRGAGSPAARLVSLTVSTKLCDVPRAWSRSGVIDLPASLAPTSPSVLAGGDVLAFVDAATVRFARLSGATWSVLDASTTQFPSAGRASDPELLEAGADVRAYFTETDTDGTTRIRTTRAARATLTGWDAPVDVLSESEATRLGALGITSLDGPAVFRADSATRSSAPWVMIARAHLAPDGEELVRLVSPDGTAFQLDGNTREAARVHKRDEGLDSNERDGLSAPSVAVVNGAYQLYYAARRGTRVSIALLVSDDLRSWHGTLDPLTPAEVLAPAGGQLALGDPSLLVTPRTPTGLAPRADVQLTYAATDGARSTLAFVARTTPASREFFAAQ